MEFQIKAMTSLCAFQFLIYFIELLRVRNSESSVVGQLYYNLKMLFKDTCRIDVDWKLKWMAFFNQPKLIIADILNKTYRAHNQSHKFLKNQALTHQGVLYDPPKSVL